MVDCLAHGAIKIIEPLPPQPLVEGGTDVSAGQPEFDAIRPPDQLVLGPFWSTVDQQKTRRELTLIVERIMLAELKTALAGAVAEAFSVRFKASMAVFNTEIASPCSLGRWDPISMIETGGGRERTVQRGDHEGGLEP